MRLSPSHFLRGRKNQFALVKMLSPMVSRSVLETLLRRSAVALVIVALFGLGRDARAATDTWAPTISANWADTNWTGADNPPLTGDALVFGSAGSFGVTLTDNLMTPSTYTVAGITFSSGAAAFVIKPGTAGVNGFTLTGGINNAGTALETINDSIAVNTTQAFTTTTGGGNITISGNISGAGGVSISGSGTLTLSGSDTYTGTTTDGISLMTISGYLGTSGASAGAITVGSSTNTGVTTTLTLSGTEFATALTLDSGNSGGAAPSETTTFSLTSGSATISGAFNVDGNNGNNTGLASLSGGVMTVGSLSIGRDSKSMGTAPVAENTDGLYVHGATLNVTGALNDGVGATSSANMDLGSGTVTVGGLTTLSSAANSRYSVLSVTGGTFNANGGMQLGGIADNGSPSPLDVELLITGGVFNTTGITFGGNPGTGGAGTQELLATGGTIYIGSGGILSTLGTATIDLGPTTVGASAAWTSTNNMTLNSGATTTFKTASSGNTPTTIGLSGVLGSSGNLSVTGGGTLTLSGVNTYTGTTTVAANTTLTISGAGDLQNGSYAGNIANSGTFTYGSSANQTLSGVLSGAGMYIQNGPGTLSLSGDDTFTTPLTINGGTLAMSGAGMLNGGNYPGNIANSGTFAYGSSAAQTLTGVISGTGGVNVSGAGALTLTNANTYTGPTLVNSGTLVLTSAASLGETPITVASGARFLAQPGSGNIQIGAAAATLTLNAGASFSMQDGSIGTLTLEGAGSGSNTVLTLGGTTASPAILTFEIGSAGADELIVNNGLVSFAGSAQDNITLVGATGVPGSLSNIPLLSAPNGTLVLGDFVLSGTAINLGGTLYTPTLSLNPADTALLVSFALAGSANYYFNGALGSSWSTIGNFSPDHSGTSTQSTVPNATGNVYLTADTASNNAANYESETLDGSYTINSLSFTGTNSTVGNTPAATNSITLSNGTGTNVLTINAANSFTDTNGNNYLAGIGLVDQAGSAAHIISANIALGASQAWEIDSSNPLTVSGVIANGSTADALFKTGSGTLILENAETYSGGTAVTSGTLMLGPGGSLLSTGTLTVSGTGTFDLGGNNQTLAGLAGGSATGSITASAGTSVLSIINSTADSFSGAINDNNALNGASLALALQGSSSVTLSGSSNFSGGTTLSSGNLTVASNYALGNPTSQIATAGLNISSTAGTLSVFFTSPNPTIASLSGTGNVILGNTSTSGSTTLHVGGGGAAQTSRRRIRRSNQ